MKRKMLSLAKTLTIALEGTITLNQERVSAEIGCEVLTAKRNPTGHSYSARTCGYVKNLRPNFEVQIVGLRQITFNVLRI